MLGFSYLRCSDDSSFRIKAQGYKKKEVLSYWDQAPPLLRTCFFFGGWVGGVGGLGGDDY